MSIYWASWLTPYRGAASRARETENHRLSLTVTIDGKRYIKQNPRNSTVRSAPGLSGSRGANPAPLDLAASGHPFGALRPGQIGLGMGHTPPTPTPQPGVCERLGNYPLRRATVSIVCRDEVHRHAGHLQNERQNGYVISHSQRGGSCRGYPSAPEPVGKCAASLCVAGSALFHGAGAAGGLWGTQKLRRHQRTQF